MDKISREKELLSTIKEQPYLISIDGVKLNIRNGVFPPDKAYTSKYLADILKRYNVRSVLDMGCGSGYLAIVASLYGTKNVWAADIYIGAIECTKENVLRNNCQNVKVVQSDLFENISKNDFDLIVFNQPYYPTEEENSFGGGGEAGRKIIIRFLKAAERYLNDNGKIIMPFSDISDEENNPGTIAKSMGYNVKIVFDKKDDYGKHVIYEITSI